MSKETYSHINKENYSLDGKYTKIALKLNPYSKSPSTNVFRLMSDNISFEYAHEEEAPSIKELAAMALNFTNGHDFYTGEKLVDENNILVLEKFIHRDHLIPASKGGLYAVGNVVITTEAANIEKSDMNVYDYYKWRIENNKPCLYKTVDEAFYAINLLTNIYKKQYPHAYEFAKNFDETFEPMSLSNFFLFSKLLVKDNDKVLLFNRNNCGKKRIEVSSNLLSPEFWEYMNNVNSPIWEKYSEVSKKDFTGSRLIHFANKFSELNIDVIKATDQTIDNICNELIKDKTENEKSKYRIIRNNIKKHRDEVQKEYFWTMLLDKESDLWKNYAESSKRDYTGARLKRFVNEINKLDLKVNELSEDTLQEIFDNLTEEKPQSEQHKYSIIRNRINYLISEFDKAISL